MKAQRAREVDTQDEFDDAYMSSGWKTRRNRIVLPLLDHPNGGLTRKDCTNLKVPSPRGISDLRGIFERMRARSLDDVAQRKSLDDFLEIPGVSEAAVAVFTHLMNVTKAKTKPWDWVNCAVKITRRKEQLRDKKKRKRKK